ncbi:2'-5' RNA ligase family protein [Nocardioides endophyticus]|uniref:2'-5' RNA ligase family protein n=1 Tax=Nocardioides endophyticus TaxID=1353775 RepID=A0ABP8ZDY2_9ACTN
MSLPSQTAVIIPVSVAEPVVGHHRMRLDTAAPWGVPAHITILFPFVAPSDVDGAAVARLAAVFAATAPFDCTFTECGWFGQDVLWLRPDRAQVLRDLTSAVAAEFPAHKPYGGEHDDVVPHLTVGESRRGSAKELRAAEVDVSSKLPFTAHIDHGLLIAGTDQPDSWHTVATLPLGSSPR